MVWYNTLSLASTSFCSLFAGGWWVCQSIDDISGPVCIEIGPQSFVSALDTGLFTVGAPHDEGIVE